MTTWTAIVLAGSRPGIDPFAQQFGTDLKALIPVCGEPMIRRPVRALLASERIGEVRVLAQDPQRIAAALPADPRLTVSASKGTIAETLEALRDDPSLEWPLLVTTADHALLDTGMIADICRHSARSDIVIGVVEQAALRRRLPDSKRTWIRLKGGAYTGANLFLLRTSKVVSAIALWREVEQDRKKGWRLLSILGPGMVLGAFLRLVTLKDVLSRAGHRLGIVIRAVKMADPLAAVDVDKVQDHELVEAILQGRA
jgi:GTP:adenosylcobinamide-phosphate guanylyltransferase